MVVSAVPTIRERGLRLRERVARASARPVVRLSEAAEPQICTPALRAVGRSAGRILAQDPRRGRKPHEMLSGRKGYQVASGRAVGGATQLPGFTRVEGMGGRQKYSERRRHASVGPPDRAGQQIRLRSAGRNLIALYTWIRGVNGKHTGLLNREVSVRIRVGPPSSAPKGLRRAS